MLRAAIVVAYLACIPAANYAIGHVGAVCVPNGPCLIPVGFGLMAPSGVLFVGLSLVLRDIVQRWFGIGVAVSAMAVGTILSALLAPPALVIASGAAFALSEAADALVYTPLAVRRLLLAVGASCLAGAVVDSAVFVQLAFGNLDHLAGQVVGKVEVAAAALPVIWLVRRAESHV